MKGIGVTFYHKVCGRIKTQLKLRVPYQLFPGFPFWTHQKLQGQGIQFAILCFPQKV